MTPDGAPLVQRFQDDLEAAVDKYRDQGLTLGEAIGALEVAKLNLWIEMRRADDEEEPGVT